MKTSRKKPSRPKRQTEREFLDLQRLMAGVVMNPLASDGGMRERWRDGRSMRGVVAGFIKPNDRLTSFERLEIYNRQYWYRIKDCFYEDYQGLRAILGPEEFEKLAEAYLTRHPSHSFTLRNLGQDLLQFLEKEPRWIASAKKPTLEMARLEWAHIEAFDSEAEPTLEVDSLLGADPSEIYLRLQPYVRLLPLAYEMDKFLIDLKQGERGREEASNAMEQKGPRRKSVRRRTWKLKPIFLALHRHQNSVFYKRLDPAQFHLLSAFQSGQSLAVACDNLTQSFRVDVADIQAWFKSWAGLGWFCRRSPALSGKNQG